MPTLLDIVAASVPLKRRGKAHWGRCPWHQDKTSSFKVELYKGKWRYHCFSCGEHGDAIDWLMRWERVDFKEACRRVGQEVKADPLIAAQRTIEEGRRKAIDAYRDRNPDCACPDWLLAT